MRLLTKCAREGLDFGIQDYRVGSRLFGTCFLINSVGTEGLGLILSFEPGSKVVGEEIFNYELPVNFLRLYFLKRIW